MRIEDNKIKITVFPQDGINVVVNVDEIECYWGTPYDEEEPSLSIRVDGAHWHVAKKDIAPLLKKVVSAGLLDEDALRHAIGVNEIGEAFQGAS